MTDQSLPGDAARGQVELRQPDPGDVRRRFVNGSKWGAFDGALAVACLKASRVLFLTFDADGNLQRVRAPARADAVRPAPRGRRSAANGDLLDHHRQRRRRRRDPAGQPEVARRSGGPVEAAPRRR